MNLRRRKLGILIVALVLLFSTAIHHNRQMRIERPGKQHKAKRAKPKATLPRLLELGAVEVSPPCQMMAKVLAELKLEFHGKLQVEYIDVSKDVGAGHDYQIRMIPTQILFNAAGEEIYRHEGFWSKQEIIATWKELGIECH
jgi:thioredoxin 1